MKKIFTLLSLVMTTLCAMAQTTFSGTWHSNPGNFADFESTVVVTVGDNGTSTIEMRNLVLGNDDLGTIVLRNVYTEQNGETYSFAMGSGTTFDITGGNLSGVTKGAFEGYGTMDGNTLYLKANYLDYGTTSLRVVVFNGTKIYTPENPDGPNVVSTETFSNVLSVFGSNDTESKTNGAKAILCKYSDDTYGITFKDVASATGAYGDITVSGIAASEGDNGELELSGSDDVVTVAVSDGSALSGRSLRASVNGKVDEDGNLVISVYLIDTDDEDFDLILSFENEEPDEPWEPMEPVSMEGTLTSYTKTDDGEFGDTSSSVLTIEELEQDKYTLTVTNASLPNTSITLGTVTIPSLAAQIDENTSTMTIEASNVEATTQSDHPYYQTLTVKQLSCEVKVQVTDSEEDDDNLLANARLTFTIDNNSTESVTYTFATNGFVTGVSSVAAGNGAHRVYTIGGVSLDRMQRGVNIVVGANGKAVKVAK